MTFDYEGVTREHYKNPKIAQTYHDEFTAVGGLNGLRYRLVATAERRVTRDLLRETGAKRVLDLPTGTGKMAPIFQELGVQVVAADISEAMLDIARSVYASLGYKAVEFVQCDAESVASLTGPIDVVVCIRLMHRVPKPVRLRILHEFAKVASVVIVSYGINSVLHRIRRAVRRVSIGGLDVSASEYPSMSECLAELSQEFRVVKRKAVLPVLSGEHVFLISTR